MSDSVTLLHKSKAGADCGSDHNQIVATDRVKPRKLMRHKSQPKLQTYMLMSENGYRQKVCQQVSDVTEQVVSVETRRANQRGMTNDILDMMEERRLLKHNEGLYRQKDAAIKRECHKAKDKMLSQQCDLIEQLDATNNLMPAHIKRTIGAHKGNSTTTCIEDNDGNIITGQDKIRTHWFEYVSELYRDDSRDQLPHIKPDTAGMYEKLERRRSLVCKKNVENTMD